MIVERFGVQECDDTEAIIEQDSRIAVISTADRIDLTRGKHRLRGRVKEEDEEVPMEHMEPRDYGTMGEISPGVLEGAVGGVGVLKEDVDLIAGGDLSSIGSSHI